MPRRSDSTRAATAASAAPHCEVSSESGKSPFPTIRSKRPLEGVPLEVAEAELSAIVESGPITRVTRSRDSIGRVRAFESTVRIEALGTVGAPDSSAPMPFSVRSPAA
jgi:hypothetical protein